MATFDVIVLGGGWGGYAAAVRASAHGLHVAVVEQAKLGGTCLHRGCIPTKVLLETADLLALTARAVEYGIRLPQPELDFEQVCKRKDEIVDRLYNGLRRAVAASGTTVIEGEGRFLAHDAIEVRENSGATTRLEGGAIIIATGSRPKALAGAAFDGQTILDSDRILERKRVPESLIVLGAGAVGVEFASCFNDYGAQVTLVEQLPAVLPLEDADVSTALARSLSQRGIRVLTGARAAVETIQSDNAGVRLGVDHAGSRESLQAECLLVAIGREPLTGEIGIEAAGVDLDRGFVAVDQRMQTNVPGIYAAGDCTGGLLLAHVAAAQGVLAADVIANRPSPAVNFERLPRVTYCRPQVASVGLTEAQARAGGRSVKSGRAFLRVNGKSLINGESEGFVKLVGDADSGDLLGLHLIGAGVSELIAGGSLAEFLDCSVEELALNVYPHPTLSEALGEAAAAALREPVRLGRRRSAVETPGAGEADHDRGQ